MTRTEYLLRAALCVLQDMNDDDTEGFETGFHVVYDGVTCDTFCLASDIRAELNIDSDTPSSEYLPAEQPCEEEE